MRESTFFSWLTTSTLAPGQIRECWRKEASNQVLLPCCQRQTPLSWHIDQCKGSSAAKAEDKAFQRASMDKEKVIKRETTAQISTYCSYWAFSLLCYDFVGLSGSSPASYAPPIQIGPSFRLSKLFKLHLYAPQQKCNLLLLLTFSSFNLCLRFSSTAARLFSSLSLCSRSFFFRSFSCCS